MKQFIAFTILMVSGFGLKAQFGSLNGNSDYFEELRTISVAVPIIAVSPDARAGGMGDVGAATAPDAASVYWNTAKLAFLEDGANGLSISYTPWLNRLVNDINLAHLSYVSKIDDRQGLAVAMRYFSLGEINFRDQDNQPQGTGQPYELTLNVGYGLQLSDNFSMGVGLRFIFSDLTNGLQTAGIETTPGSSLAADLGFYYQGDRKAIGGGQYQSFTGGLAISNVGGKISYGTSQESSDFLPANIRLGAGYHLDIDKYNRFSFYADLNKLLVPTPPVRDENGEIVGGIDNNVTAFEGVFQSFNDAPGGFGEELEEININIGAEYWYDKKFAFRGGYQYEDLEKGGRQYYTIGLGIQYNVFGLDFAYLIPASATVRSPLENTLRFTLLFNFEQAD
jgi:hypothetical protein